MTLIVLIWQKADPSSSYAVGAAARPPDRPPGSTRSHAAMKVRRLATASGSCQRPAVLRSGFRVVRVVWVADGLRNSVSLPLKARYTR